MVHTFYDGPGLLAAVHASAALGGADSLVEWRYFDLEAQLYGDAIIPKNGSIAVPRAPDSASSRTKTSFATIECREARSSEVPPLLFLAE